MCDRDVGSMGERCFGIWCSSVGITANKSDIDRTGWDFIVEFPWEKSEKIPKDMLLAPIECKVQVKSTDNRESK